MVESTLGPSASGSVVIDLGPGQGALVLHTPPEFDGREIEISPLTGPPRQREPGSARLADRRTHSLVRPRHTALGVLYAAVYPGLPADDYGILDDNDVSVLTVSVHGGAVCTATWPGHVPAHSTFPP